MLYEGGRPGYVGLAHSADGIRWERDKHNPVITTKDAKPWEKNAIVPQSIARQGTTWHLFYHANNGSWQTGVAGVASSEDLIHWTRYESKPILRDKSAMVLEIDDRYIMYAQQGPTGETVNRYTLKKPE
jgi:predicted GH43/DUF377 family glycosyl hydrolase